MKRLLTWLGVDYDQWKALTIVALKLDLRTSTFGGARSRLGRGAGRSVIGQIVFYLMMGFIMALFVGYLGDRFVAGTILFSYAILMVGTAMLVDHNAAITSPEDYGILGYQPITSRTFFVSKLTNALVYTLGISTALGLLPVGVLFAKYGIAVGGAAIVALYVCATTVTLTIVAGYATLVQRVGPRRLRMWLSYVQLATGFVVYGGYFLTAEFFGKAALATLTFPRTAWLSLIPPTWFASYLEVAAGSLVRKISSPLRERWPSWPCSSPAFGVGCPWIMPRGSASFPPPEPPPKRPRRRPGGTASYTGLWFRGGEARAVAILVRSHFRNDMKFRMGVLAILPLTAIYLIMGLRGDGPGAAAGGSGPNLSLVTMAAMLFPVLLKTNLARSDAYRASWVFFSSPTDRIRLIRSSKNVLVAFFLIPYLAFLGVILALITGDLPWVTGYLLLVGAVSHLALLGATVVSPELPFSLPMEKGRGSSRMLLTMIVIGVLGGLVPLLSRMAFASVAATAETFVVILLLTLALRGITRRRVERQSRYLEFQG